MPSQELSEWVVTPLLTVPFLLENGRNRWPEAMPLNSRLQPLEAGGTAAANAGGIRHLRRAGTFLLTMDHEVRVNRNSAITPSR